MSPLGAAISAWLHTGPGIFIASTADGAMQLAYEAFIARSMAHIDFEGFKAALDRTGYRPQPRKRTGSDDGACDWSINLPETR